MSSQDRANRRILIESIAKPLIDGFGDYLNDEQWESVRVVVRISSEFHEFIESLEQEDYPPFEVADYIIGTIRSGFDFYFEIFFLARMGNLAFSDSKFSNIQNFKSFRMLYLAKFDDLSSSAGTFETKLPLLLELWGMHFIFVGWVLGSPFGDLTVEDAGPSTERRF